MAGKEDLIQIIKKIFSSLVSQKCQFANLLVTENDSFK